MELGPIAVGRGHTTEQLGSASWSLEKGPGMPMPGTWLSFEDQPVLCGVVGSGRAASVRRSVGVDRSGEKRKMVFVHSFSQPASKCALSACPGSYSRKNELEIGLCSLIPRSPWTASLSVLCLSTLIFEMG